MFPEVEVHTVLQMNEYLHKLVGDWTFICPYVRKFIIPIDELMYFSEGLNSTTNQLHISDIPIGCNWYWYYMLDRQIGSELNGMRLWLQLGGLI